MISKDKNNKGQQILEAAIRFFSIHGYERVKVSDITDELGIGKGTFYLYYNNKRDLLLDCFNQLELLIAHLERRKDVRNEKDFTTRMKNRMVAFASQYSNLSGILQLLRNECNSVDLEIRENARRSYSAFIIPLQDDIQKTFNKNDLCEINAELAAYTIVGIAESLAFRVGLDQQIRDLAVEFFQHSIQSIFYPTISSSLSSAQDFLFVVTDNKHVSSDIKKLQFNNNKFISGFVGEAEILIEFTKIDSLTVKESGSECSVDLLLKDGQKVSLVVDNSSTVTGETAYGTFKIPLKKVNTISFPS